MVKIQTRVSKRHYLRAKRIYEYGRMSLDIPKKFHEVFKPFLEKELNTEVKLENDVAVISLSPVKTFRHAENTFRNQLRHALATSSHKFCLNICLPKRFPHTCRTKNV